MTSISVCGRAESLTIIQPSANLTIAPMRDILIKGTGPVGTAWNVKVDLLKEDGTLIRTVCSDTAEDGLTPESSIYIEYAKSNHVNTYNNEGSALENWMAPGLIYDGKDPASFADPRNKAVVYTEPGNTERSFAAVIYGGITKDYIIDYDKYITSGDLTEGNYRLVVSLVSDGEVIASGYVPLKVAYTEGTLLSRYSNTNGHQEKLADFMGTMTKDECKKLDDLFPGYWNTFEITRRWRPNDSHEYTRGNVWAILYDIHEWNATQNVELAYLTYLGEINSDRVKFCRYDIGEPRVNHRFGTEEGRIIPMEKGEMLAFTRAERYSSGTELRDNIFDADDEKRYLDTDLSDGIQATEAETLSIYGVVTPIPCSTDVTDDKRYIVKDRIAGIHYSFKSGDIEVSSCDKPVGLNRIWTVGGKKNNTGPSLYEFRHDFKCDQSWKDTNLLITADAYTSCDRKVVYTKTISLDVRKAIKADSAPKSRVIWLVVILVPIAIVFVIIRWQRRR